MEPVPDELVSRLHLVAVTADRKVVVCRSEEGWRFEQTGVQVFGDAKSGTCSFTGESHPASRSFDVRGLIARTWNTMGSQPDIDESSLLVWGEGDTWGSNPKLRALVRDSLPDGWSVSGVDQRGYTAVQYCLTAPSDGWYYVHDSKVEKYGDTGTCSLDPEMKSSG